MSKSARQRSARTAPRSDDSPARAGFTHQWLPTLGTAIILAIAMWLVYGRAIDAPFIFDDHDSIVENSSITRLCPLAGDDQAPGPLSSLKNSPMGGRPLVNLSLAINYHFGRLNPRGYHLLNIAVHLLSALLLGAIIRRALYLDYFGGKFNAAVWPLSLIASLIWAVHPLQTESVIYTTQRTELFVGFCYLATLYSSLRYWTAPSRSGRITWQILAAISCLAGAASKEMIVTAPLVVLLFERTFVTGSFRQALRQSWRLYAGLALSWLLLLALNYDHPRGDWAGFHQDIPAYAWWFTQAKILWMYLRLAVWPWPLVIHYGTPIMTTFGEAWPWLLLSTLLALLTILLLWRHSALGFLAAATWLILSPTLVVPIVTEVAAERRMYLPLAALVVMAVIGIYAFVQRMPAASTQPTSSNGLLPVLLGGVAAGVIAALIMVSARRATAYETERAIWEDALLRQPDDAVVRLSYGIVLLKAQQLSRAIEQFQEAVRLKPNYADAHNNLAGAYLRAGRQPEALNIFDFAVQMQPDLAHAQLNYGVALVDAGRLPEALDHLQTALRLKPQLAEIHYALGTALIRAGRMPEAIDAFRQALALKPDYPEAYNNLGLALAHSGRVPEAIDEFAQALKLNPESAEAHYNLGDALLKLNRPQEAADHFQQAIRYARSNGLNALAQAIEDKLRSGTTIPSSSSSPGSSSPPLPTPTIPSPALPPTP